MVYLPLVILAPIAEATTAVAIIDRDAIILGTDSLWRGSKAGTSLKCKINIQRETCVYVLIGLRSKPETNFDSSIYANRACKAQATPKEQAIFFGDTVRGPLSRALRYSRINDATVYKRDYQGKVALEGLFAGFENGKPIVAFKSFRVDENDVTHERLIEIPNADGGNIGLSGQTEAALSFLHDHPSWQSSDSTLLVRNLIQAEIEDKPDKVGAPIDILVIDKSGHRWIPPYGTCAP
jgi:hypothetical protein